MNESRKTKARLITELNELRQRVAELETAEAERRQTDEILQRYQLLSRHTRDIVFFIRAGDGRILEVNDAAIRAYGYERQELLAKHIDALRAPGTKPLVPQQLAQANATGILFETLHQRKDGSLFPVEVSSVGTTMGEGRMLVSIARDITERKRATVERENLLNVLEASLNEVYIFNPDTLKFQYVNQCATRNLGYSIERLKAMTPVDLKPEFTESSFRKMIEPVLRREKEKLIFQTVHRRADASLYPVEVHLQLVEREAERVFLAVILDITERKRAEEAVQESHDRLLTILDSLDADVYVADLKTYEILFLNRHMRESFGDNLVGQICWQVFRGGPQPCPHCTNAKLVDAEGNSTGVCIWEGMNPITRRWYTNYDRAVQWIDGRLVRLQIAVDITERKQTEEALRESEERYRGLYENAPIGIYRITPDGRILAANPTIVQLLGYDSFDELARINLEVDPDTLYQRAEFKTHIEREGKLVGLETWWRRRDGTPIFLRENARAIHDAAGDVLYYDGTVEDISERKQFEEELRLSEERYRTLAQNLPDSALLLFDQDLRIMIADGPEIEATGFSREMLEGKVLQEALPPEFAQLVEPNMRRALAGERFSAELPYEDRFYRHSYVPLQDNSGNVGMAMILATNITARKRAEKEVETLARFPAENPSPVLRLDLEGRLLYANLASEPILQTWGCAAGQRVPDQWREVTREVLASHLSQTIEIECSGRIFSLLAAPVVSMNYVNLYGQDVTARKQAEQQLRAFNRSLKTISECNQALARATDESQLLHDICQIIVELGGYRLAWVGYAEQDEARTVRPAACAGYEAGYLETASITWADTGQGRGPTGIAIRTGQPYVSENIATDPAYELWRAAALQRGYVSSIALPLIVNAQLLGAISIYAAEPDTFDAEEQKLLSELASDLAYGITALRTQVERQRAEAELSRLNAELKQRVTELALLYDTGLTFTRLLDPPLIAQRFTETLAHMNWHHIAIRLKRPESDELELLAFTQPGLQPVDQAAIRQHMQRLIGHVGQGMSGWVIQTGQPIRAGDLAKYPQYVETFPGIHSGLYMPLKVGDEVIGVIAIESEEANAFGEHDERFLSTLASQAAVALQNARLLAETRRRLAELEAISSLSAALRAASGRGEMLPVIVNQAADLTGAEGTALMVPDPNTEQVTIVLAHGTWADLTGVRLPANSEMFERLIVAGEPYVNNDLRTGPILRAELPGGQQATAAVPLIAEKHTIGLLWIDRPTDITSNDLRLLTAIADIAANALHRASVIETLEQHVAERTRELQSANDRLATTNVHLTELDQLKDEFVSRISHELRTPMSSIKIYLELLEHSQPEKRAKYLTVLTEQTARLQKLIEDMLDISHLQPTATPALLAPIHLIPVIRTLCADWAMTARDQDLSLIDESAPDLPLAFGEASALIQALTRLLSNAVNYTPRGGTITVSTATRQAEGQTWVTITVKDTGPGITPYERPHIFDRFYRGQAAADYKTPGTGLGLPIAQQYIRAINGHITVESESGHGAAFTVWLRPAPED